MGKKTRVTSLTVSFELELDGYVFGRVAMLAGDLHCISKSRCHKKARLCNAQINRNWPVFPSSFFRSERLWTGLDLAFTSIWVIELPGDVAPAVGAIITLGKCACFQQSSKSPEAWTKTDSLIDWLDWLIHSLDLADVIVAWCLLMFAVNWLLSF